jgi:hypothetical protein
MEAVMPGLKYLVYIVYHDEASRVIAEAFGANHSWAVPVFVRSTPFFESIAYQDLLLPNSSKWEGLDYVGMISYKATNIQQLSPTLPPFKGDYIPEILARAQVEGHDAVPFLRSPYKIMHQATFSHTMHFQVVWYELLKNLGYNEAQIDRCNNERAFFRNAFVARPEITKSASHFFDKAINIVQRNETLKAMFAHDSKYGAYNNSDIQQRVFGTDIWQFHPFVFERLLIFYFCAHGVNSCNGPLTVCTWFWC